MYFFFSGEGKTDFGTNNDQPGPLAHVINQIIAEHHQYSLLASERIIFVHRAELERIKNSVEFKPESKRSIRLPSRNVPPETRYHYDDARAFSRATKHTIDGKDKSDREFVAVLFRDSNSPDEKEWNDKRNSMLWGFHVERIEKHGVAAVARPISEAWWLSALDRRTAPNQGTKYEEMRRGGIAGDHRLKKELGDDASRDALVEMIHNKDIDYTLIDSASFLAFLYDFRQAVGLGHLNPRRQRQDNEVI